MKRDLALLIAFFSLSHAGAQILLDFGESVPGTIREKSGKGTGFTHRLTSTGSTLPTNDPNLDLSSNPGRLTLTSTHFNISGQTDLANAETLAVRVSGIGTNDFSVSALFRDVRLGTGSDQLMVFVASGLGGILRAGPHFDSVPGYYAALNTGGIDFSVGQPVGRFELGDDIRVTIHRSSGSTYRISYENLSRAAERFSDIQTFDGLNGAADLYFGVLYANPDDSAAPQTSQLDEFEVMQWQTVYQTDFSTDPGWTTSVPEQMFWDSSSGRYYAEIRPGGDQYAYVRLPVPTDKSSFKLEFDLTMVREDYAGGLSFGLSGGGSSFSNPGIPSVWTNWAQGDGGTGATVGYRSDTVLFDFFPGPYDQLTSLESTYHNEIIYDRVSQSLRWILTSGDEAVGSFESPGAIGSFTGLDRVLVENINTTGTAAGYIDNVVLLQLCDQEYWALKAPNPVERVSAKAAALSGKTYVFGGQNSGCPALDVVQSYDPESDAWETLTPMPAPRMGFAVAPLGGSIYLLGGETRDATTSTVWKYTPSLEGTPGGPWQSLNPVGFPGPAQALAASPATAVFGEKVYIFGGRHAPVVVPCVFADWQFLDKTLCYDPSTDTWEEKTPLPGGAVSGLAAATCGSKIYVLGGDTPSGQLKASFYEYSPLTDTWVTMPDFPYPIVNHSMGSVGGSIYVAGGIPEGAAVTDQAWRFDCRTQVWQRIASMPEATSSASSSVWGSLLVVVGGCGGSYGLGGPAVFKTQILNICDGRPMLPDALQLRSVKSSTCTRGVVRVVLTNGRAVEGFSLGIAHDPEVVRALTCEASGVTAALRGGEGPEFWIVSLNALTGDCEDVEAGITVSMVGSLENPAGSTIPPGVEQEVAVIAYEPAPGLGSPAETALRFVDCLRPGENAEITKCVLTCNSTSVEPAKVAGSIRIAVCFKRGDCNCDGSFDISDPITILNWLSNTARVPKAPCCMDACDANDDGLLDVSDGIRKLSKLFLGSQPLPEPFRSCGADPTEDGLGCEEFPACP